MERTVKIRLDGGKTIDKKISAVTFGELKKEVEMTFASQKVIIRESRLTLEDDSAHLPLTDFTLFVYPLKVKSGGGVDYAAQGYQALRKLCAIRKFPQKCNCYGELNGNYGTVNEMVTLLEKHDKKNAPKAPTASSCSQDTYGSNSAKDTVIAKINNIQKELDALKVLVTDFNVNDNVDKINKEFEQVRKVLVSYGV